VTSKTYPDGGARAVHYGYDLRNLQLFARFDSPSGEGVTNAYDGFGRLASSSTSMSGVTRMLSYGYDDAGNRISIKHPDGNWFGMWYDALGRRYYIHANNVLGMAMLGFAPHGGLAWVGRVGIASYIGFDGVQRPATLAQTAYTPSASTDVAFSFARNPAGQITSLTRDNDAYAWTGHYAANRAYTANGLNQYSAAGNAMFGYDANGNLASDGSRTYAYDIENRLVSSSNGAALTYDPLGSLYQVTLGTGTTRFLYDGDALVAEYDGAGTLLRRHAHWAGADVPVATFDVSGGTGLGTLRYLFADQQGSIIAEANGSGAVTQINRYDEYGIPAATNVGRFQYTGQAWLAELGMYYYKARIYSPTLGRFMQTDPVGYTGGTNLYAYVGDDPMNATDPTGLAAFDERRYRGPDRILARALNMVMSARGNISVSVTVNGRAVNISKNGNAVSLTTSYHGYAIRMSGTFASIRGSEGFNLTNAQISGDVRASANPGTIRVYSGFRSGTDEHAIAFVTQNAVTIRANTFLGPVPVRSIGRNEPNTVIPY
jgi:RHS repeat-associated protein